ncbi:hypothetical protein JCM33374_g4244 [Metschnikowia sp. JCM 33374]|nr:hypothetical protein JCM33374_g4244 [Metschnikowia sp. JCM 33374]
MINKKTLSLKLNKSFQIPSDAPFTPVEQTLHTPVDAPNQNTYFGLPSSALNHESSFFSQPQDTDSDDVLTDVDEPSSFSRVIRNYSVSFTPLFDQILMSVYSHILSLPTTTPFSGYTPPSGLASRVANETLQKLITESDPANCMGQPLYDVQGTLNHEQLKDNTTMPIVLQLIRKRLLDLCSAQKTPKTKGSATPVSGVTSIQVPVSTGTGNLNSQGNPVYIGAGLRQSSISTLSLTDQNTANYQQNQAGQNPQSALLAGSRSRSSSLDLRKHSLTRNNSMTGSSWLHVGNLANVRSGGNVGTNPEYATSTDSLQSMNDFVPHAFLTRSGSSSSQNNHTGSGTMSGFNSMMMDYQTPPSSSKSSISQGSHSPSYSAREAALVNLAGSSGSLSDTESNGSSFSRTRSLNRGGSICSFPKPLTINTDVNQYNNGNSQSFGFGGSLNGETLHSPFVSAISGPEDFEYFGQNTSVGPPLDNTLPSVGLRSGSLNPDCQVKDGSKVNIPSQYTLSEKKRDSLKLKRGIY